MITTILIVLLSICIILLAREILKLKERLDILHNETNNRISVTDQQIHLRINSESKLLQSNIDEVKTDLVNLINQRLDEEIDDVKKLIPPTNDELMERMNKLEKDSYTYRMSQ